MTRDEAIEYLARAYMAYRVSEFGRDAFEDLSDHAFEEIQDAAQDWIGPLNGSWDHAMNVLRETDPADD